MAGPVNAGVGRQLDPGFYYEASSYLCCVEYIKICGVSNYMNPSNATNDRQPVWQQQLAELQERARRAFLAQDLGEMRLILSDDFIVNSPINRILNKGALLELLQQGVIRHFSYEEQIELMTRQGEIAVVMGNDVVTDTLGGPLIRRRFTNVWREGKGRWQLIARHAHHIAES